MSASSLQIIHGRVVDPASGTDAEMPVYVERGRIVGLGTKPEGFEPAQTIDAKGWVVAPGLVDLSARGLHSRQEQAAALAGGVTTVCCPPDTQPPLDEPDLVESLRQQAERNGSPRVLPIGALTSGLRGETLAELAALKQAGCIAFSQAGRACADNRTLRRAMQYAATYGYALWLQPEDRTLAAEGVAHDGEVASRLGLSGIPVSAETVGLYTMIELARETGVRLHFTRLSSAEGVAIVRAAQSRGLPVSSDVSIHHLHFSDADIGFFNTAARLTPPLRAPADRAALAEATAHGGIDAICSDHSPVTDDGKLLPFGEAKPGATAIELLLPLTLAWAATQKQPLARALSRITQDPARIAGISAGRIEVGQWADLCLFDPDASWQVTPDELASRGKHTLCAGQTLRGRVQMTLLSGKTVFNRSA